MATSPLPRFTLHGANQTRAGRVSWCLRELGGLVYRDGGGEGFLFPFLGLHDECSIEPRILSAQTRRLFKGAQPII